MSQTSEIYSLYLLQSCNLTYLVSCVAASDITICTLQFVVVHQHAPPLPSLGCWIILQHCQSSPTKPLIQRNQVETHTEVHELSSTHHNFCLVTITYTPFLQCTFTSCQLITKSLQVFISRILLHVRRTIGYGNYNLCKQY